MGNNDKEPLLDHDADGIREYDNSLPRWWLYGFYFTIIMSVIYLFYYHVYGGPDWNFLWYGEKSQEAEYDAEVATAKALMPASPKGSAMKIVLLTDQASLDKGKKIFNSTNNLCFTCHRSDLGGQIGPNLTDQYWMHGCTLEEIVKNITSGFPEKGMLPFGSGNKLSDRELLEVASYVISNRGTNPPDPKPIEVKREIECNGDS
jgi:cytochrome c oxidase cbb3-type subunit 3